jgi:hypothetical protein
MLEFVLGNIQDGLPVSKRTVHMKKPWKWHHHLRYSDCCWIDHQIYGAKWPVFLQENISLEDCHGLYWVVAYQWHLISLH